MFFRYNYLHSNLGCKIIFLNPAIFVQGAGNEVQDPGILMQVLGW
jgi:hypothetical protein